MKRSLPETCNSVKNEVTKENCHHRNFSVKWQFFFYEVNPGAVPPA